MLYKQLYLVAMCVVAQWRERQRTTSAHLKRTTRRHHHHILIRQKRAATAAWKFVWYRRVTWPHHQSCLLCFTQLFARQILLNFHSYSSHQMKFIHFLWPANETFIRHFGFLSRGDIACVLLLLYKTRNEEKKKTGHQPSFSPPFFYPP